MPPKRQHNPYRNSLLHIPALATFCAANSHVLRVVTIVLAPWRALAGLKLDLISDALQIVHPDFALATAKAIHSPDGALTAHGTAHHLRGGCQVLLIGVVADSAPLILVLDLDLAAIVRCLDIAVVVLKVGHCAVGEADGRAPWLQRLAGIPQPRTQIKDGLALQVASQVEIVLHRIHPCRGMPVRLRVKPGREIKLTNVLWLSHIALIRLQHRSLDLDHSLLLQNGLLALAVLGRLCQGLLRRAQHYLTLERLLLGRGETTNGSFFCSSEARQVHVDRGRHRRESMRLDGLVDHHRLLQLRLRCLVAITTQGKQSNAYHTRQRDKRDQRAPPPPLHTHPASEEPGAHCGQCVRGRGARPSLVHQRAKRRTNGVWL